ncbi:hypothetical protein N8600_09845 [Gammaproteobacteria bacterium]|nr:hypothetical protein [Gammaproteobacteria bacterium]
MQDEACMIKDKGKKIKVGGAGRWQGKKRQEARDKRKEAREKRQATPLSGFNGFL